MAKNNKTADRVQAALNFIGGDDMLDALMAGRATIEVKLIQILNWIGTVTTSATTEKFVAKEKFVKDSKEVKFCKIWDNFRNWFLDGDGKIEDPICGRELRYGELTEKSLDGPIIKELGGEAQAETTLSELYDLLKKQANGGKGFLLTSGMANIFYIRNTSGVLRAVFVDWVGDGWGVHASSVGHRDSWSVGRRVFSRNS